MKKMKYGLIKGRESLMRAIKKDSALLNYEAIEVPQDVKVSLEGKHKKIVKIEGKKGKVVKDFSHLRSIEILKENQTIYVARRAKKRKEKSPIRTVASKIRNAISGVQRYYIAHHKVIFSHFPVRVYTEENNIVLENFYGRREDMKIPLEGNVEVEIEMEEGTNVPSDVFIKGPDKEAVTQTSSKLKEACKLRGKRKKDVRVFQDGIWPWKLERERK